MKYSKVITEADLAKVENKCLPIVTTSDNGKILMVVDGVWTVVDMPTTSEATTE